jgi:PBSX family phage portal protein
MSKPAQENSITLDAIDKEGRKRKVRLRAVPIGPDEQKVEELRKQEDEIDAAGSSNAEQMDPFSKVSLGANHLIEPPYPLHWLCAQRENNTELGQCINAMATNTVGFGWTLRERPMPDALKTELHSDIESERDMLRSRLTAIHPTESLDMILEKVKLDQHSCGNGYIELIDDNFGELVGLNHVVGHAVRLTEKPSKAVKVAVPVIQTNDSFKLGATSMWYRFRRYAMMLSARKIMWFKEAGDPRLMDKWTGEFSSIVPAPRRATSLLHFKNYNSLSAYGVPHWIGNLFSIRGSRRSEEINYNTLTNNNIPSMFVIVENGALTEASIDRLKIWTEQQVSKGMNYSKFLLLEGETVEDGSPNPQNFKIKVHPLANLQKDDQLFQNYDQNNREKIRQSFRLPPIFVGRCHSDDTEYLTEHGWLPFDQIGEDYRLATVNKETGMLEFQLPTERFSYDWDGPCLRIKSRTLDSLTTPHHRFLTKLVATSKDTVADWEIIEGHNLTDYAINNKCGFLEIPVSAGWSGFTFDDMMPIPSSLLPQERDGLVIAKLSKMIVCFIGSYVAGNSKEERVKLENEITKLAGCSLGIEAWVRQTCGITAEEKKLPRWVFDLNEELLKVLLNSMLQDSFDFTEPKPDVIFQYATLSKQLNDDLHELCLRLGISMVSRSMNTEAIDDRPIWRSYGQKTRTQLLHPSTDIRAEHYTGKVSCFTVLNDTLVTRRNGRVLISGNTTDYTRAVAETSRSVADEQVFAPDRNKDIFLLNRFVILRWGTRFHTLKLNNPNVTDDASLINLMGIAERSGGMTPRRADRIVRDVFGDDIGPMPDGIPLDVPFTVTFAQAQSGMISPAPDANKPPAPNEDEPGAVAQRMVGGLLDLRQRIEAELDGRFDNISNKVIKQKCE